MYDVDMLGNHTHEEHMQVWHTHVHAHTDILYYVHGYTALLIFLVRV